MSDIVITSENFKRFSKRLQKNAQSKGFVISLVEAQNLLAETLGTSNYHEMMKILSIPKPDNGLSSEIPSTQLFVNELMSIIHKKGSYIAQCYMDRDYGNIILTFTNHSGQSYSIYFGDQYSYILEGLTSLGTKEEAENITNLIIKYVPTEKYAGLLFGSKLFNHHHDEYNNQSIFKYSLPSDGSVIQLNNIYYRKRYAVVTLDYLVNRVFEKKNEIIQDSYLYLEDKINPPGYEDLDSGLNVLLKQEDIDNPLRKVVIELYYPCFFDAGCMIKDVFYYDNNKLITKNIMELKS